MYSTVCIFVSIFILTDAKGLECNLKPPTKDEIIDWSKLTGATWYQFLNERQPLDINACYVLHFPNISQNEDVGIDVNILDVSDPLHNTQGSRQEVVKNDPWYKLKAKNEQTWEKQVVKVAFQTKNKDIQGRVEELKEEFANPMAFFTDYDNYLISIVCKEDDPVVFVFVRQPKANAKTILDIFNTLTKHGAAVSLYLSDCFKIDDIDQYLK